MEDFMGGDKYDEMFSPSCNEQGTKIDSEASKRSYECLLSLCTLTKKSALSCLHISVKSRARVGVVLCSGCY